MSDVLDGKSGSCENVYMSGQCNMINLSDFLRWHVQNGYFNLKLIEYYIDRFSDKLKM